MINDDVFDWIRRLDAWHLQLSMETDVGCRLRLSMDTWWMMMSSIFYEELIYDISNYLWIWMLIIVSYFLTETVMKDKVFECLRRLNVWHYQFSMEAGMNSHFWLSTKTDVTSSIVHKHRCMIPPIIYGGWCGLSSSIVYGGWCGFVVSDCLRILMTSPMSMDMDV